MLKFIIFFIFFLIFNYNLVKSDDCDSIGIEKVVSCGSVPSSIIFQNYIVNISSIDITPLVKPIYSSNSVTYNLVDGTEYSISYSNIGCTNKNIESYTPNGAYYQLTEQPKCRLSAVNLDLYNMDPTYSKKTVSVQQGIYNYKTIDGCLVNIFVIALNASSYPSPSDVQVLHSMCGFSNGTIKINTLKYSDIQLSQNSVSIKEASSGYYSGLSKGTYSLSVTSKQCGLELLSIEIKDVYPQIAFDMIDFSNYIDNSTMSFSFPSKEINSSMASIYLYNDENRVVPSNQWSSFKSSFPISSFIYTFKYNYDLSPISVMQSSSICLQKETIETSSIRANVEYSMSRPSSCKDNVTISFTPHFQNDVLSIDYPQNSGYYFVNNKLSVPYNSYFAVKSYKSNSVLYIKTPFQEIKYKIDQVTNENSCWSKINITVLNYKLFSTLRIESHNHGHGYTLYPTNGVFSNVADNRLKLVYKTSDCQTESYVFISTQKQTTFDKVSIEYQIKKNSSCTQHALVGYTLNTPFGLYSGEFNTSSSYKGDFLVPNSYCYYELNYQLPSYISNDLEISTDTCNALSINSNYQLISLTANGKDITNTKQVVDEGSNEIIAYFKNGNYQCYSSSTINVAPIPSDADIYIQPVDDCLNSEGIVQVNNYQDYDSIKIVINNVDTLLVDGFITVQMGEYLLKFEKSSCVIAQKVIVGGNIIPTITTSTIRQPTCNDSGIGDGLISVAVSTPNYGEMNNFEIVDLSGNVYSYRVFTSGTTGINSFKVRFYNCLWSASHTLSPTIEDPLIDLQFTHNSSDCTIKNIYKVISNNSNVNIQLVSNLGYANSLVYYQTNYFITDINSNSEFVTYDVKWNGNCKKSYKTNISKASSNLNNIISIEAVKPYECSSNTLDIVVKNMNLFVSGSVLVSNKQPTYINSTHSIFKNLVATEGYLGVSYTLLNGCSGTAGISSLQGVYTYPLDFNITNEVCYSSNGKVTINNYDSENYYYKLIYGYTSDETEYDLDFNSLGQVGGLSNSNQYRILRVSKKYGNCKSLTPISISTDQPKIESISIINPSNQEYNNGSIRVLFNFIPSSPVTYEVVVIESEGSVSSDDFNGNTLQNVPPGKYQIKATITDSGCPITLTSDTITISSDDSVSLSNIIQFEIQFIILSILIILLN